MGVQEGMHEKCTDINLLLSEIERLKQSPWYLRGKDESNWLSKIQYIERKEAVEIVEDLCIKEAPIEQVVPLDKIKNLRKQMSTISRVTDGEKNILYTCLAMIDDLIEDYEVNNDNRQAINYLRSSGLTEIQIATIIGALQTP